MAFIPERILECTICFQRLNDPRFLTCNHIFCRTCITDWLNNNNECPICRREATLADLKQLYVLDDILNNINKLNCEDCHNVVDKLRKCDHCSKDVCVVCETVHIEEVKAEVREACDELMSVTLPSLEELEVKIGILMSESSSAKDKLTAQLRQAHEVLADRVAALKLKSLNTIGKIVGTSHPSLNDQILEVESLIARIRTCISESVRILSKQDLKALVILEGDVDRLLMDINDFHEKQEKRSGNQTDPLRNLRINPAYKWIANVIAETEMVRKSSA